jgi:hypothetical protein
MALPRHESSQVHLQTRPKTSMTRTTKSTWTSPSAYTTIAAPECSPQLTGCLVWVHRTSASTTTSTDSCPLRTDRVSFPHIGTICTSTRASRNTWTTRSAVLTATALSHLTGAWVVIMHHPTARCTHGRLLFTRTVRAESSSSTSTLLTRVPLRRLALKAGPTVQVSLVEF